MSSLVIELESEILNRNSSVSDLLRKKLAIVKKLKSNLWVYSTQKIQMVSCSFRKLGAIIQKRKPPLQSLLHDTNNDTKIIA
jgi:hypothetical protein